MFFTGIELTASVLLVGVRGYLLEHLGEHKIPPKVTHIGYIGLLYEITVIKNNGPFGIISSLLPVGTCKQNGVV